MFVLPFYREDDSVDVPIAVIALILISTCMLAFGHYGFVPAQPHLFTAFTSLFVHVGFWHLAVNMWFLWMFGRRVEQALGPFLFLALYLLSGFGGVLLHYAMNRGSAVPCVGTAGAISGIAVCFLVLFPRTEIDIEIYVGWWRVKRVSLNMPGAIAGWIGVQTVLGFLTREGHLSPVTLWVLIGGFFVGLVGSLLLKTVKSLDVFSSHGSRVMSKSDLARFDVP